MFLSALLLPSHISTHLRDVQKELLSENDFYPAWAFDILVPLAAGSICPRIPVHKFRLPEPFSYTSPAFTGKSLYLSVNPESNLDLVREQIQPADQDSAHSLPFPLYNGIYLGDFGSTASASEIPEIQCDKTWKKCELAVIEICHQHDSSFSLTNCTVIRSCRIVCS